MLKKTATAFLCANIFLGNAVSVYAQQKKSYGFSCHAPLKSHEKGFPQNQLRTWMFLGRLGVLKTMSEIYQLTGDKEVLGWYKHMERKVVEPWELEKPSELYDVKERFLKTNKTGNVEDIRRVNAEVDEIVRFYMHDAFQKLFPENREREELLGVDHFGIPFLDKVMNGRPDSKKFLQDMIVFHESFLRAFRLHGNYALDRLAAQQRSEHIGSRTIRPWTSATPEDRRYVQQEIKCDEGILCVNEWDVCFDLSK